MASIPTKSGRKLPPPIDDGTQAVIDKTNPHVLRDSPRFRKRRKHPSYDPANHTRHARQCYQCGQMKPYREYYNNGRASVRPECITCFSALRASRYGKQCPRCNAYWQYGVRACATCALKKRQKECARWLMMPVDAFCAWAARLGLDLDQIEALIRERQRRIPRRGFY